MLIELLVLLSAVYFSLLIQFNHRITSHKSENFVKILEGNIIPLGRNFSRKRDEESYNFVTRCKGKLHVQYSCALSLGLVVLSF